MCTQRWRRLPAPERLSEIEREVVPGSHHGSGTHPPPMSDPASASGWWGTLPWDLEQARPVRGVSPEQAGPLREAPPARARFAAWWSLEAQQGLCGAGDVPETGDGARGSGFSVSSGVAGDSGSADDSAVSDGSAIFSVGSGSGSGGRSQVPRIPIASIALCTATHSAEFSPCKASAAWEKALRASSKSAAGHSSHAAADPKMRAAFSTPMPSTSGSCRSRVCRPARGEQVEAVIHDGRIHVHAAVVHIRRQVHVVVVVVRQGRPILTASRFRAIAGPG